MNKGSSLGPHSNALYTMYNALVINVVVSQNYYCNILLLNASLLLGMVTFKTEVLYLISNVQLVYYEMNTALPCYFLGGIHDMHH